VHQTAGESCVDAQFQNPAIAFELFNDAVLTCDIPNHDLCRVDVVKLVDYHAVPDVEDRYSIEVFNILRETIAVTAVPVTALEAVLEKRSLQRPQTGPSRVK